MELLTLLSLGGIKKILGSLFTDFFQKYGLKGLFVILMGIGIFYYGQIQYERGVTKTSYAYELANNKNLKDQKDYYEKQLSELKDRNQKLEKDRLSAVALAERYRKQNDEQFKTIKELQRVTQTSITGQSHPFTVGFAGLFNASLKAANGGPESEPTDVFSIIRASGVNQGSTVPNLSDPIKISTDQVLDVSIANAELLGRYISERRALKQYFIDICKRGMCTTNGSDLERYLE